MKFAYVDTSCLVAVALTEPGWTKVAARLARCSRVYSSNLLEAELLPTLSREGVKNRAEVLLEEMRWVHPDRPLSIEIESVLKGGYLKGADTWHLACALYLRLRIESLGFLSLDPKQLESAAKLEFEI